MKVKVKRCLQCKSLLSNSSKVCTKCGRRELEKGLYTNEPKRSTVPLAKSEKNIIYCPTCNAGIASRNGYGVCSFCGDEILGDGSSYYHDYIDQWLKKGSK